MLLLPQGNYPLKNLHTVIKALPAVLAEYGDAELRIAGWPPLDKGPLLRPVIDRMFPYKLYCKRLAAQLGVTEQIRYTGPLDAAAMRQAYLEADVFLLPSGCENSPNSLGEAMLLGLPCVASAVGGIPSMLASGTEGLLYGDALDADALARAVLQVLHSPDGGAAMGRAAVPAHCRPMMRPATPLIYCTSTKAFCRRSTREHFRHHPLLQGRGHAAPRGGQRPDPVRPPIWRSCSSTTAAPTARAPSVTNWQPLTRASGRCTAKMAALVRPQYRAGRRARGLGVVFGCRRCAFTRSVGCAGCPDHRRRHDFVRPYAGKQRCGQAHRLPARGLLPGLTGSRQCALPPAV